MIRNVTDSIQTTTQQTSQRSTRRLGLIGGMSWESTTQYYTLINQGVKAHLGGLHSADLLLWSFDFATIAALQEADQWDIATEKMIEAAQALETAGAEAIMICTNTMHVMADAVANAIHIPLLHIGDATRERIISQHCTQPLLLGTAYTMTQDFYRNRLEQTGQLSIMLPHEDQQERIHAIIYNELCQGVISPHSKQEYLDIIQHAQGRGADSVIFGCTEIGLLIQQDDLGTPAFDTTQIHARAAVEFSVSPL